MAYFKKVFYFLVLSLAGCAAHEADRLKPALSDDKISTAISNFLSNASSNDSLDVDGITLRLQKRYHSANGEQCFAATRNTTPIIYCDNKHTGDWYSIDTIAGQVP